MKNVRFVVGIDLGTTNSAVAFADLEGEGPAAELVRDFAVTQLVAPGECAARRLLPSCAYLPAPGELAPAATALPWGERAFVVGELAKGQGARVPGRLVASAKSWLCHAGVDRTAPILPWGAPEVVRRVSPVAASTLYLSHVRDAWDAAHPNAPLAEQDVVLTVPASFDEVARELTLRAAIDAGLPRVTLLEEPQAAFYWWSAHHAGVDGRSSHDALTAVLPAAADARGAVVLVVDVGGGTSDFTLMHARITNERPELTRLAVGEHILLGGDNVDVTLARTVEPRLGGRIDAAQFSMLVQACRSAKEALLSEGAPDEARVVVAGRGSRLVGATLGAGVTRAEVEEIVLGGFFPACALDAAPLRERRVGFLELGLPYASDPAVTKHLAAFLAAHVGDVEDVVQGSVRAGSVRPDAILLNGGVFTPRLVQRHLANIIGAWFAGEAPIPLLATDALDVGVARGAAWYGLVRRGRGVRIGGGAARAYFVGVDASEAMAGDREQLACIIPRHLEAEVEVEVPRTFSLVVGRPVRFPLYATTRARHEQPGELAAWDESFEPLPPIETALGSAGGAEIPPGSEVPVRLRAVLREVGTLELWCAATKHAAARWKLEFQVRGGVEHAGESDGEASDTTAASQDRARRRLEDARALIEGAFSDDDTRGAKALPRELERLLGSRDAWPTPLCRALWQVLFDARAGRKRSAEHERVWCSLTGFCIRPGFGAPLDAWRAAETFKVYTESLVFPHESANWSAWWILWRRVAGGLDVAAQKRILDAMLGKLKPDPAAKSLKKGRAQNVDGMDEMIRMLASLERIAAPTKVQAGLWILERLADDGPAPHLLWAVGRLGARVPLYGSVSACVPPPQAGAWAKRLAGEAKARPEDLAVPLAQLARMTGDRARDIEPSVRDRVLQKLVETRAPESFVRMVREVTVLEGAEEQRFFGDSLPRGLRLTGSARGAE
jgi:molecular chaperone DnaK (HSP70)